MQITCSKCKKVYNVNPNKIPSGITSTKCKACGNTIPLPQSAPQPPPTRPDQAPPPPKAGIMQITCQYCSKQYNINPKAVPEGVTSIKCKACGHTISLKSEAAAPVKPDPVKTAPPNTGTKEITCLYCGKKYSINAAKIPPGMTTTKCKACGRPMSLMNGQSGISAYKNEIDKEVIQPQQQKAQKPASPVTVNLPPVVDAGQPVNPIRKKPWVLAIAAGILMVVLAGYFAGTHWSKLSGSRSGIDKIIGKKPAIQKTEPGRGPITTTKATKTTEPFLALILNVPLLMEAIDRNLPEEKKDIKYKMTTGILESFGFGKIQLYLYPDPQHTVLPVILATSKDGKSLEKHLKSQNNYIQFFERGSDGSYRINQNAIPEEKQNNFPIDRYRLQFVDNTAVFAPENLSQAFIEAPEKVLKTRVAQMIASIAQPRDLAVLSVKIPENLSNDWQKKIQSNPALQQNPQAAMVAAMGGGMLSQLSESLKSVESLAIGFRLDESNGRVLHYAQQFRKGVDSRRIYQQLRLGNPNDLNVDGIALKLIALLDDPRYKHQIGYKNNRLTLELNWEEQYDKALITSLSEATLGQIFAQSMDPAPSKSPAGTQYTETPVSSKPKL
jgi:transcription elongation factor Elf1